MRTISIILSLGLVLLIDHPTVQRYRWLLLTLIIANEIRGLLMVLAIAPSHLAELAITLELGVIFYVLYFHYGRAARSRKVHVG